MRALAPIIALGLTACAATTVMEPSLARRPAEAIDPRVPIASAPLPGPVDAVLATRLAALMSAGQAGAGAFDRQLGTTRRLVAAAGPAQSEGWILAQQSLSALEASQVATTRALADIDELAARKIQAAGGLSVADLAAVEAASAQLRGISDRQSQAMASLTASLAR